MEEDDNFAAAHVDIIDVAAEDIDRPLFQRRPGRTLSQFGRWLLRAAIHDFNIDHGWPHNGSWHHRVNLAPSGAR